jgi:hypothetical protein
MRESIEKHSFGITVGSAVSALLFVVYSTASLVQIRGDLVAKTEECKTGMSHIVEELNKQDSRIAITELASNEIRVKLAELSVQVSVVNASLLEIKQFFKIK